MGALLVRNGENAKIPPEKRHERSPHKRVMVYGIMFAQICREYHTLPDLDTITAGQIRWFYDMLRPDLIKQTAPKPEGGK